MNLTGTCRAFKTFTKSGLVFYKEQVTIMIHYTANDIATVASLEYVSILGLMA